MWARNIKDELSSGIRNDRVAVHSKSSGSLSNIVKKNFHNIKKERIDDSPKKETGSPEDTGSPEATRDSKDTGVDKDVEGLGEVSGDNGDRSKAVGGKGIFKGKA